MTIKYIAKLHEIPLSERYLEKMPDIEEAYMVYNQGKTEDLYSDLVDENLLKQIRDLISITERKNGLTILKSRSKESLFSEREIKILDEILSVTTDFGNPGADSITVVIKATRLCNLRCDYCASWSIGKGNVISFRSILERTVQALVSVENGNIDFVWHGGEVTLLGPKLLEKMLWVQQNLAVPSQTVNNFVQTNGFSLSEEWIEFFSRYPIPVGVSIDGPKEIHDSHRKSVDGGDSYERVINTIKKLQALDIDLGVLIVVGAKTVNYPIDRYCSWLIDNDIKYVEFLNVAPSFDEIPVTSTSHDFVAIDNFVEWLLKFQKHLDENSLSDMIKIRMVEDIKTSIYNRENLSGCYFSGDCHSTVLTINPDGKTTPCDKYVSWADDAMSAGADTSLPEAAHKFSTNNIAFGADNFVSQDQCRWRYLCKGGCPHDSMVLSSIKGSLSSCCGFSPLFDYFEGKRYA